MAFGSVAFGLEAFVLATFGLAAFGSMAFWWVFSLAMPVDCFGFSYGWRVPCFCCSWLRVIRFYRGGLGSSRF